jgi:anti-sigma factor RsiW
MAVNMTDKTGSETEVLSEADEIAALLPWYVSGKISAEDKARIDAYAEAHPELKAHIALAREEADVVFSANQEITVPWADLDKLKEKLESGIQSSPSAILQTVRRSLFDRIGDFLASLSPRQLAYAGVAAALAIAIQAVSIGSLLNRHQGEGAYQTASSEHGAAASGSVALVTFNPTASASALSQFLAENNFAIVDGPRAGGVFRVRISEQTLDAKDIESALAKLKAHSDLVSFASAAPPAQ